MGVDVHTGVKAVPVARWWRINPDSGRREEGRLLKRGDVWEVQHDGRDPVRRPTETAALVEVRAIIGDAWVWQTLSPERRKRPRAGR